MNSNFLWSSQKGEKKNRNKKKTDTKEKKCKQIYINQCHKKLKTARSNLAPRMPLRSMGFSSSSSSSTQTPHRDIALTKLQACCHTSLLLLVRLCNTDLRGFQLVQQMTCWHAHQCV
jgi:hypothetical protein